jgi:pyruvate kinase
MIRNVRKISKHIPILIDIKGPDIRVNVSEVVQVRKGGEVIITTDKSPPKPGVIQADYATLENELMPFDVIFVDDGLIELKVKKIKGKEIICTAITGGPISNRKGINIPFKKLKFPKLSDSDRKTVLFAKENNLDFIGVSFARGDGDIEEIRKVLGDSKVGLIAKIENHQGMQNLDLILESVDALMVARGDLGLEMPNEMVPVIQKELVKKCNQVGKPVIVATQMLESMINNKMPTRAETSDVANAIFDGTDAIMLSGETAVGKYPIEAVKTMVKIAIEAEKVVKHHVEFGYSNKDISKSISRAVYELSISLPITRIVPITTSGYTARLISRFKPTQEIIAVTDDETTCRQLNLSYGVLPVCIKKLPRKEKIAYTIKEVCKRKMITQNDLIIITCGISDLRKRVSNLIRVHKVNDLLAYYKKFRQ